MHNAAARAGTTAGIAASLTLPKGHVIRTEASRASMIMRTVWR